MMRSCGLAFLVTVTSLFVFATAWAEAPWSLFGRSYPVKEGPKSNSWAVALPSRCPETSSNCLADGALVYSGVNFEASNQSLTFRELYHLSTSYKIMEWDCGGGSPRFIIGIDTDGDRKVNGHVFAHIGPPPGFTGCDIGVWKNTGNLINPDDTDARYDIGELVAQFPYLTYREALTTLGDLADKPVLYIMLVVDGGWLADQLVLVDHVRVNSFKLTADGYAKQ